MECSPARLAANRANALKSTGPRTDEGKDRSRANAYKHGMAGEGVVLAAEEEAKVERIARGLEAEFRPSTDLDRGLVRRVAVLSARADRCAAREAAAISARVLTAEADFDEGRIAEAEGLMAMLDEDPAAGVRQLRRTPEGVDRMVAAWLALRADLACAAEDRWGAEHRRMAENLTGRRPGEIGLSRVEALARAIRKDFTLLGPGEGAGLGDERRSAWARERMIERIDAEVAGLRAHRETLDLGLIERLRGLAPEIALFDPSKPAQLARRYEAEAERGMYRALRELRQRARAEPARGREPGPVASTPAQAEADLLGSFRAIEATGLLPALVTSKPRPDPSKMRPMPPSRRDRPAPNSPRDASTIVVGRG